jgi:hypothetical protein
MRTGRLAHSRRLASSPPVPFGLKVPAPICRHGDWRARASLGRLRRNWRLAVASIVCFVSGSPAWSACDGTSEQVVGFSGQRDKYVIEERSPNGAEPSRYLTRRLTSPEVLDYVTCAGAGRCTMSDALGMKACSFRPVPPKAPEALSVDSSGEAAGTDVRLAGKDGPVTLLHLGGAEAFGLRSGARAGSNMILFLTSTQDEGGCRRTVERAVMVTDPESAVGDREAIDSIPYDEISTDVDLGGEPGADVQLRIALPPTLARKKALTTAARTAAAAHLDALAGCWARQALSMATSVRHHRHKKRPFVPPIQVEDLGIFIVRSTDPAHR